ncbi:MAG TPA: VWA domain-containing protein, partial [Candidatus Bathyarchaeia archaeon]|nr:VWA domain-containing protein [Candidatus Bathyarchaeia archaeon]
EPMCLLALTRGGLKLIHDFTDDPTILAKAVRDLDSTANPSDRHVDNPAPLIHERVVEADHISADAWNLKGGTLDDKLATNLNRVISNLLQEEGRLGQQVAKNQAFITVDAMRQISKAFGGFPGRKSLIWVSSGFPFSLSAACPPACANPRIREVRDAYDNLWKMMNDAQIAIYSVDLRLTSSNVQAASQTNFTHPYDVGDPVYDVDAQTRSGEFDATSSLVLFAENTGGKAFLGGGNLIQSFQQSVQDDSSYYMLGYYVKPDTKPGWHGISVAVHAKGAQVRHRNGFLLSRDISATSARQDIELALRSPLDFASLPVSVTWLNKEPDKQTGKTKVEFDLVMPANFAAVDESDQNHMVVDVVALARNTKGDVAGDLSQRIDEHL